MVYVKNKTNHMCYDIHVKCMGQSWKKADLN